MTPTRSVAGTARRAGVGRPTTGQRPCGSTARIHFAPPRPNPTMLEFREGEFDTFDSAARISVARRKCHPEGADPGPLLLPPLCYLRWAGIGSFSSAGAAARVTTAVLPKVTSRVTLRSSWRRGGRGEAKNACCEAADSSHRVRHKMGAVGQRNSKSCPNGEHFRLAPAPRFQIRLAR